MRNEQDSLLKGAAPPPKRGGRGSRSPNGRGGAAGGRGERGTRPTRDSRGSTRDSTGASNGVGGGGGGGGLVLKQVDLNELAIEEHIQHEKLQGAREVEQGAREIKECYDQLSVLVKDQGDGIDQIETQVSSATVKVQSGQENLKSAGKEQKRSRKLMCYMVIVLVVVIAIAVVVIIIMKK